MPAPCFNTDTAFGDTLVYTSTNSLKRKKYSKKDSYSSNINSYSSYNTYVNSISSYSLSDSKPTSIYDRYDKYKSEKKEMKNRNGHKINSSIYSSKFLNVFDSEATITSISSIQSTLTVDSIVSTATSESRKRVSFSDEIFYIPPPIITKEDKKKKKSEKDKEKDKERKSLRDKLKSIREKDKDKGNDSDKENNKENVNKMNEPEKKSIDGEKKRKSVKHLFKLFNGKKDSK